MSEKIAEIPYGDYCYTSLGFKDGKYKIKPCPYWEYGEDDDGCSYGYCHYLEKKDYVLLWDMIKICGINELEDEQIKQDR